MYWITCLLQILTFAAANETISHLIRYGYISDTHQRDDIESAVRSYQEYFNLPTTGIIDNATIELMNRPRCGNTDDILFYSANLNNRLKNNTVTWYMYGPQQYNALLNKAFGIWAKHSNLTIYRSIKEPMIKISISPRNHSRFSGQVMCQSFDGPGKTLAHAFIPDVSWNDTEIHMDEEEPWVYSTTNVTGGISFFSVMIHEIGHALGLGHTHITGSVMFPTYQSPKPNVEYDLSEDDVKGIQLLYGKKPNDTTTTTEKSNNTGVQETGTTSTTEQQNSEELMSTTTVSTNNGVEELIMLDMCTLKNEIKTFLIVDNRLYAFHIRYVWVLNIEKDLRTREEYTQPRIITHWLPFLHNMYYFNLSAVYQRPNDEIVMYIDTTIYFISFPSLTLLRTMSVGYLIGRKAKRVNAVFNGHLGKTYLFVDDFFVYEIDECTYRATLIGSVSNKFEGIPGSVNAVLRYMTGRLYAITDNSVIEYNEFTNSVTGSYSNVFEILDITCMKETVIRQLYKALRYLQ